MSSALPNTSSNGWAVRSLPTGYRRSKLGSDSLKGSSEKGGAAMDQARQTMQSVEQFVEPESPLSTQLSGSLEEVSEAGRSLRLLANLLDRNPSVLVRGRATQ